MKSMNHDMVDDERTCGDVAMRTQALRGLLLREGYAADRASDETSSARLARSALDYIENNICDRDLSLGNIARALEVSTAKLSRSIKDATGVGYLEIVNRRRIELAKQYLLQDTVSIKQLAKSVGFDNDVTFRRLFKKYEGTTPSEYSDVQ